jgi:hypothetical protein
LKAGIRSDFILWLASGRDLTKPTSHLLFKTDDSGTNAFVIGHRREPAHQLFESFSAFSVQQGNDIGIKNNQRAAFRGFGLRDWRYFRPKRTIWSYPGSLANMPALSSHHFAVRLGADNV